MLVMPGKTRDRETLSLICILEDRTKATVNQVPKIPLQ